MLRYVVMKMKKSKSCAVSRLLYEVLIATDEAVHFLNDVIQALHSATCCNGCEVTSLELIAMQLTVSL